MSYALAFAAVPDCKVEWCEYFGSYSGRLLAKIIYKDEVLYLHDWFGSCSVCDAFEAEFSWGDDEKSDYQERLSNFGKPYVESALPLENIIKALEADVDDWADDVKQMLEKLYAERSAEQKNG